MKYVIFEGDNFVLLPEYMNHSFVRSAGKIVSIVAAGFCKIESYEDEYGDTKYDVSCWGESYALGVKSRGKEDEMIIRGGMR